MEFREGDLAELPAGDGEFGAAVAFYSIIHLEPGELTRAFGEIRRVLRPAGRLLIAFHAGSEVRHQTEWWGQAVDLEITPAREARGNTTATGLTGWLATAFSRTTSAPTAARITVPVRPGRNASVTSVHRCPTAPLCTS